MSDANTPPHALASSVVNPDAGAPRIDIGFLEAGGLTLRRMLVRGPRSKGTVLLLHGFPESVHAWKDIALSLGRDHEVHAFDWPGFGFSARPDADAFPYSPRDYARVLAAYIDAAGIDRTTLTIYATDIGALPALLLAVEQPDVARALIVGDFAPFDRPELMSPNLQALKAEPSAEAVRTRMNANADEIIQNTFTRGLPDDARYEVSDELRDDITRAWNHGAMTSVDAFAHYYRHFSRDQQYLEANIARLKAPVKVVWGEKDLYISKDMGIEFAAKARAPLTVLAGIGHYPHLQAPEAAIAEIRASFD
jgi:pimeloyl-ACP methyl ester carboxylesterase